MTAADAPKRSVADVENDVLDCKVSFHSNVASHRLVMVGVMVGVPKQDKTNATVARPHFNVVGDVSKIQSREARRPACLCSAEVPIAQEKIVPNAPIVAVGCLPDSSHSRATSEIEPSVFAPSPCVAIVAVAAVVREDALRRIVVDANQVTVADVARVTADAKQPTSVMQHPENVFSQNSVAESWPTLDARTAIVAIVAIAKPALRLAVVARDAVSAGACAERAELDLVDWGLDTIDSTAVRFHTPNNRPKWDLAVKPRPTHTLTTQHAARETS